MRQQPSSCQWRNARVVRAHSTIGNLDLDRRDDERDGDDERGGGGFDDQRERVSKGWTGC